MIAVGIDVSKSKSTVAILNSDGTPLARPFNMAHTLPEMNSLVERLRAFDTPVTILMEYTGHYHYPVLKKLQAEGFPVCLINPYQMKKYGDVEIHKAKTDRKDAVRIATYALEKAYKLTPYSAMEQKYEDLRFLSRQYGQRIADVSRLKTQLLDHLDQTMPGITSLLALKSRTPDNCVLLLFIKRFNSFDEIHRIGKPRFLSAYSSLVKKTTDRYAASKALAIYELALNSITTRGDDPYIWSVQRQCVDLLASAQNAADKAQKAANAKRESIASAANGKIDDAVVKAASQGAGEMADVADTRIEAVQSSAADLQAKLTDVSNTISGNGGNTGLIDNAGTAASE